MKRPRGIPLERQPHFHPSVRFDAPTCAVCGRRPLFTKKKKALPYVVDDRRAFDTDFVWAMMGPLFCSPRVLDCFEREGLTGFVSNEVSVTVLDADGPETIRSHRELLEVGWGGYASAASGLRLTAICDGCDRRCYSIDEPSRVTEDLDTDGSDFLIIWPVSSRRFISDRAATVIRDHGFSGIDLIAAEHVKFLLRNTMCPVSPKWYLPEEHARRIERAIREGEPNIPRV
jgi:hypothetical protein